MWLYYRPIYKFSQVAKQQCECDIPLLHCREETCGAVLGLSAVFSLKH